MVRENRGDEGCLLFSETEHPIFVSKHFVTNHFFLSLYRWDNRSARNSGDLLNASSFTEIFICMSNSNFLCTFFFFKLDVLNTVTTVFIC